eukprot:GFYU01018263.1.p1 GENE.GFYU01018263.1~~GFYU01018263.1.p1  ORF type:complete len:282 (-),score=53.12 GFYU01018263.1:160-1005(-)
MTSPDEEVAAAAAIEQFTNNVPGESGRIYTDKEKHEMAMMLLCFTVNEDERYWTNRYCDELAEVLEAEDDGYGKMLGALTCWFGAEVCAKALVEAMSACSARDGRVVDVGTGNGHMCRAFRSAGFADVMGVDYNSHAIKLAKYLQDSYNQNHPDSTTSIAYNTLDFTDYDAVVATVGAETCCIVHDKSTLDSIAMVSRPKEDIDAYAKAVSAILKPGGHFIITSCNHSLEELDEIFCPDLSEEPSTDSVEFGRTNLHLRRVKGGSEGLDELVMCVYQKQGQ